MDEPVDIAVAVVERNGQFLVGQRPLDGTLPGFWEFPGGKVEPGETPEQAAARECQEETNLQVTIGKRYPIVEYSYNQGNVRLHFFAATAVYEAAQPNVRFQWVHAQALPGLKFPPANHTLVEMLVSESIQKYGR